MNAIVVTSFLLLTTATLSFSGAVASLSNPRYEIHSELTSGEKAFLASTRTSQQKPEPAMKYASSNVISLGTARQEVLPLAKAHGIAANNASSDLTTSIQEFGEVQRLKMLAKDDDSTEAAYFLGLFYLYGHVSLQPDEIEAIKWFRKAAKQGHNEAQCAIGLLLYHGHGQIPKDKDVAMSYFRLASKDDHDYGHWLLGRSLFEQASVLCKDCNGMESKQHALEEAANLFRKVADAIPEASHQLAVMYEYGLINDDDAKDTPSTPNYAKSAKLYERSALPESVYHLALMHAYGRGFPQDYKKASELFRQAATNQHKPHAPSMRYLAIIFANGYSHASGIPDYEAAQFWYESCSREVEFADVSNLCLAEQRALSDVIDSARKVALSPKDEL